MAAADCLFCSIAGKRIPALVVHEDAGTIAFLDIHPKAPGHTVVIPKVHAPALIDLPSGEIGPVFHTVQRVAERLEKVLGADGLTIGINQGSVSGQTVPHLHVHVLPRFSGDRGHSIHSVVDNPPSESLEELCKRIKF